MVVLKEFLPAEATEEDIIHALFQVKYAHNLELIRPNMGIFIKGIKQILPNADGKLVAQIVQKYLN